MLYFATVKLVIAIAQFKYLFFVLLPLLYTFFQFFMKWILNLRGWEGFILESNYFFTISLYNTSNTYYHSEGIRKIYNS